MGDSPKPKLIPTEVLEHFDREANLVIMGVSEEGTPLTFPERVAMAMAAAVHLRAVISEDFRLRDEGSHQLDELDRLAAENSRLKQKLDKLAKKDTGADATAEEAHAAS